MNTHKALAIEALDQMRGDDLWRAKKTFDLCTPEELQQEWGQSGKTRAQILAEYQAHDDRCTAALEWLKGLPE